MAAVVAVLWAVVIGVTREDQKRRDIQIFRNVSGQHRRRGKPSAFVSGLVAYKEFDDPTVWTVDAICSVMEVTSQNKLLGIPNTIDFITMAKGSPLTMTKLAAGAPYGNARMFSAAAINSNDNIIAAPNRADFALVINAKTDTVEQYEKGTSTWWPFPPGSSNAARYLTSVFVSDTLFYACPFDGEGILKMQYSSNTITSAGFWSVDKLKNLIDGGTGTTETMAGATGANLFAAAVVLDNSKVVCLPYGSGYALTIAPGGQLKKWAHSDIGASYQYASAMAFGNIAIAPPFSSDKIMVFDGSNEPPAISFVAYDRFNEPFQTPKVHGSLCLSFAAVCKTAGGKMIAVPYGVSYFLVGEPSGGTWDSANFRKIEDATAFATSVATWHAGHGWARSCSTTSDNYIVVAPLDAGKVFVIDGNKVDSGVVADNLEVIDKYVDGSSFPAPSDLATAGGGLGSFRAMAPIGQSAYAMPNNAEYMLRVAPPDPPTVSPTVNPSVSPTAPSASPSTPPTIPPTLSPIGPSESPSVGPSVSPLGPTTSPSAHPSASPSLAPTGGPSVAPSSGPSGSPSEGPSAAPSKSPAREPTAHPSSPPSTAPSTAPSIPPSIPPSSPPIAPTVPPSAGPSATPSTSPIGPTQSPSLPPSQVPTLGPSAAPSGVPSTTPSRSPSTPPSTNPTASPEASPTAGPTDSPTSPPIVSPTMPPSLSPSPPPLSPTLSPNEPSASPSESPKSPTNSPTQGPLSPSASPSQAPTKGPEAGPTVPPSLQPSTSPEAAPTSSPIREPTQPPSIAPTLGPSVTGATSPPSSGPSTSEPTLGPTNGPTNGPTKGPTSPPTTSPVTSHPSIGPSSSPQLPPSVSPTEPPSFSPTMPPILPITAQPTRHPSASPTEPPTAPSPADDLANAPLTKYAVTPGYLSSPLLDFAQTPLFAQHRSPALVGSPLYVASPLAKDATSPLQAAFAVPAFMAAPVWKMTPLADLAQAPRDGGTPLEQLAAAPLFKNDFSPVGMDRTPQGRAYALSPQSQDVKLWGSPAGKAAASPGYLASPLAALGETPAFKLRWSPTHLASPIFAASPAGKQARAPSARYEETPDYRASPQYDALVAPPRAWGTPLERLAETPVFLHENSPVGAAEVHMQSPLGKYGASPLYLESPLVRLAETPRWEALRFSPGLLASPLFVDSPDGEARRSPWSQAKQDSDFFASPEWQTAPEAKTPPRPGGFTPLQSLAATPLFSHFMSPIGMAETPEGIAAAATPAPTKAEGLQPDQKEEAKVVTSAVADAGPAVGLAVGIAAGGNAGRLAIVAGVSCTVEDVDLEGAEPLDWEFHPIGTPVGGHFHRYFLGAIVFNLLIVGVILGIQSLVALIMMKSCGSSAWRAMGNVKFPGLAFIPVMFLMQGTSLAAGNMAFHPQRAPAGVAVIGWIGILICVACPLGLWWFVVRGSRFHATTHPAPKLEDPKYQGTWKGSFYRFTFGESVWINKSPNEIDDFFVERWGPLFEAYKEGYQWFGCLELASLLGLSVFAAFKPNPGAGCHARNVLMTLFLGFYFVLILWKRPYLAKCDLIISAFLAGALFGSVLCIAISIMVQEGGGAAPFLGDIAAKLLLISCLVMLAKALYDMFMLLSETRIDRNLRDKRWAERADSDLDKQGSDSPKSPQEPHLDNTCVLAPDAPQYSLYSQAALDGDRELQPIAVTSVGGDLQRLLQRDVWGTPRRDSPGATPNSSLGGPPFHSGPGLGIHITARRAAESPTHGLDRGEAQNTRRMRARQLSTSHLGSRADNGSMGLTPRRPPQRITATRGSRYQMPSTLSPRGTPANAQNLTRNQRTAMRPPPLSAVAEAAMLEVIPTPLGLESPTQMRRSGARVSDSPTQLRRSGGPASLVFPSRNISGVSVQGIGSPPYPQNSPLLGSSGLSGSVPISGRF
eukprot:Hpha_TRINITY_DN8509_c0_g1::TRINITY_DN8509_c0_g1_i1::g.146525::m.146525